MKSETISVSKLIIKVTLEELVRNMIETSKDVILDHFGETPGSATNQIDVLSSVLQALDSTDPQKITRCFKDGYVMFLVPSMMGALENHEVAEIHVFLKEDGECICKVRNEDIEY